MNTFELKIWFDGGLKCTFYTVLKDGASQTETDKFFKRFENSNDEYHEDANILLRLILQNIGNKYGATNDFFDRNKNKVQALPPKPKRYIPEIKAIGGHFPLRLYCLRITHSLVVLFNGGLKEAITDQESEDLRFKFYEVQTIAQRIMDAIEDGLLEISKDGRYFIDFKNNNDSINL